MITVVKCIEHLPYTIQALATYLINLHNITKIGTDGIPMLQIRKQRHREVQQLAQR